MKKPKDYADGESPAPARLVLEGTDAEVTRTVQSTGYPEYSAEFAESLEKLEGARYRCAAPLPIDPNASLADRRIPSELAAYERGLDEAEKRLKGSRLRLDGARNDFAKRKAPRSAAPSLATYILLAIGLAAVTGAILMPTLDELFVGRYLRKHLENPKLSGMVGAYGIAFGAVLMFCLGQLTIVWHGTVQRNISWLLIVGDLIFAIAWGVQRCVAKGHGGGSLEWHLQPMAISLTALEFVTTFIYSLALHGLAKRRSEELPIADAHREASAAMALARRFLVEDSDAYAEIKKRHDAFLGPVAIREAGARRASDVQGLAIASARLSYQRTVSTLAAAAAQNPTLDALTAGLDENTAFYQTRLDAKMKGNRK